MVPIVTPNLGDSFVQMYVNRDTCSHKETRMFIAKTLKVQIFLH